jgi:hypothetical protein
MKMAVAEIMERPTLGHELIKGIGSGDNLTFEGQAHERN